MTATVSSSAGASASGNEPSTDAAPVNGRRFSGLLPNWVLHHRQPRWWQEVMLLALGYVLYGKVRNAVPEQTTIAERHGRSVQHLQEYFHLDFELSVNQFVS